MASESAATQENPRQNVSFPSNGHQAHGYLALPSTGRGPGVIVIQEWWGLTDHIAGIADRLAAEGFVALAPDLFGGRVAHDADEAGSLMGSLDTAAAARDLGGAVDYLLAHQAVTGDAVGAVGFCMGGGFVLLLALQQGRKIAAAVPFYGVGSGAQAADFSGLTAAVQGHYGEQDAFFPVEDARALEAKIRAESGAPVEFFYYPAGHAFHNDENHLGTYDADAARTAWERAVSFLRARLG